MLTFRWKYKKLKQIEGSWNAWDIFIGLDPRLSHVPKWRPRQRNRGISADTAEHVFSKGELELKTLNVFFLNQH